ncbi:hypothetical protein ACHWQZ_G017574 [Mnemiopsis leidyi]
MDIRSFFGKKSSAKQPPANKEESKPRKKRLVISDSDDDDIVEIPVKKQKTGPSVSKVSPSEAKKKAAAPVDFFGSSKVKKETRPVVKKCAEPVKLSSNNSSVEIDDFSDDEAFEDPSFMDTLNKLDKKKGKENVIPTSSPKVSGSLSEKLSSKKKVMSWKEKIGQTDKKPSGCEDKSERKPSKDEDKTGTPSRKRPRSDERTKQQTEDKPKVSARKTLNESTEINEEVQKKANNSGYWQYKNREGPKNLGSKEIPEGAANCLEGLTFVISGVLDSIERDEAAEIIKKYGGRVTSAVSKKTDYLVKGEGVGAKKLEAAEKFNTKQIDEDELLEMIRSKPGKKSTYDIKVEKEAAHESKKTKAETPKAKRELKPAPPPSQPVKSASQIKKETVSIAIKTEHNENKTKPTIESPASVVSWTEKYRPTKVKDIIGQQGAKSNVNKLLKWLKNWEGWNKPGVKAPFNKEEGCHLKAALLSGPPGVGKTTSATVCSKELGFSYLELNASDARNKKSIKEHVADVLNNHTIRGLAERGAKGDRHVLIMDEVDGMAGNEDRGGVAELIALIKTSRIPIICICNDRNHQKIRSLANYCFDLRFYKPRVEQVKGAMMSIAFKEGLKVPPPAMQRIIEGANSDIRQILNHLAVWTAGSKTISYEQAGKEADTARKDMNIGIFDIPRLFFSNGEDTRKYTYADYNDLFFQDYSMTPFFIHENYPRSRPARAGNSELRSLISLSNAADSICEGDHVSATIKMQNWSLLPTQSHFSAIMPGFYMRGGLAGMTSFPQILGQTSKKNKCDGQLQDLLSHMVLHVSTDKRQLGMEYLPLLKSKLSKPLIEKESDGVPEVIETMNKYDLQRDDWDNIMELSTFSTRPNPASNLNTKTKSAFTRLFNKQNHMNPYALESAATKKKRVKAVHLEEGEEREESGGEGEAEDAMIKKPAAKTKKAAEKKPAAKKSASGKHPAKKSGR